MSFSVDRVLFNNFSLGLFTDILENLVFSDVNYFIAVGFTAIKVEWLCLTALCMLHRRSMYVYCSVQCFELKYKYGYFELQTILGVFNTTINPPGNICCYLRFLGSIRSCLIDGAHMLMDDFHKLDSIFVTRISHMC